MLYAKLTTIQEFLPTYLFYSPYSVEKVSVVSDRHYFVPENDLIVMLERRVEILDLFNLFGNHSQSPMPESGDIDVLRPRSLPSGLSDRRRLGGSLKLDFSALGSADDYPVSKKCKLESRNFGSAAYAGNYNVSSSPTTARTLLPQDLALKLNKSKQILILDCRPFMSYNTNHIQGAVNINCSDRFNRKRLQQGKVSLVDLVTTKEGKDLFKRRLTKEIILYDDQTSELHQIASETSMHLVLASLLREGKETFVLKGEFKPIFS